MHGRLKLAVEDLGRFSGLAGGKVAGEARIAADLDGAAGYGLVSATLDARATKLVTPYPMLDKVIGGELARDRRRPHDAGRRLRLLQSQGGRPERLGQTRRRLPAGQGGRHRDGGDPAGEGHRSPRRRQGCARRPPDRLARRPRGGGEGHSSAPGRLLDRKTTGVTLGAEREPHHRPPRSQGLACRRRRRPAAHGLGPCRQARRRRLVHRRPGA